MHLGDLLQQICEGYRNDVQRVSRELDEALYCLLNSMVRLHI